MKFAGIFGSGHLLILIIQITLGGYCFAGIQDNPEFVKLNSGTRAVIKNIVFSYNSPGYFLADKIFVLENDKWEKLDLPLSQPINLISPISGGDIWLTVNSPLNYSELYLYSGNRLEKIKSPFANEINAMYFIDKQLGFFAGWNEIAIYSKGIFKNIRVPDATREITKIYGVNEAKFWILSERNELFVYQNKFYLRILPGEKVIDFFFYTDNTGLVLCESGIFKVTGVQCERIFSHPELKQASRISGSGDSDIWIAGKKGFIKRLYKGKLFSFPAITADDFWDISIQGTNVWIAGQEGCLVYSGPLHLVLAPPENQGFTKNKLYEFGGDAHDEYGVAIADMNGDGRKDIYSVCIFSADRLYIKQSDSFGNAVQGGWFREEALKRGASGISKNGHTSQASELHLGVAAGDIDNDGDQDLYLCCLNGKNKLLINDGHGYFRDVSDQQNRACEDFRRSNAAVFADVDNDGDLDLFLTSEHASNKLFLNDGTGHFNEYTAAAGLASVSGGMCASFADVNDDGLPDLCVSFWFRGNRIYLNRSAGGKVLFKDITAMTDIGKATPARSNAVVFGDVNNDGSPDLLITNRKSPNKLFLNDGQGFFKDVTESYLGNQVYQTNGAVIADFNLDGFNDIFLTNVGDNVLYKNIKGQTFADATSEFNAESLGYGTGCATSDIDNDGDIDIYAANYLNGNSLLFLNTIELKKSVTFYLTGTTSNRDAIGSQVTLYRTDSSGRKILAGYQEVNGGSGYGSVSSKEIIFGLSPDFIYSAKIWFPKSNKIINISRINPGEVFRISEETGLEAIRSQVYKAVERLFIDTENQLSLVKYIFALVVLTLSFFTLKWRDTIKRQWMIIIYTLMFILFAATNYILRYETTFVSFFIPPLTTMICILFLHLVSARIRLKRKAYFERQEVREKISRDLHDDLASTLGSISIYSDTLNKRGVIPEKDQQKISEKITELSHSALQSITDIIWMTSPRNDSLKSLLSKIRNYYYDLFNDNCIRFSSDIDTPESDRVMQDPLRQNIFLIMKETAANILRHSNADHVMLRVYYSGGFCYIEVKDNGHGFDPGEAIEITQGGNGLVNMRRRASESGINLKIQSEKMRGTQVILSFKMT